MHDLAPIGLSVYARLEHLQQTICALKNNYLAKKSMLYVFSDGPKVGDEDKVESVRAYLQTVTGFKDVVIIERDKNNRVFNNRDGQRMLIERYGKMIYIEEDVVTSPYFLMYMNDALDFYKDDERIFAITGFSPNTDYSSSYMSDVVLTKRMFAWAFAIWKDRYDLINMNINMKDYWLVRWSANKSKKYCIAGSDMLRQLRQVASGNIEALDTRINYTIFSRDMYLIAPRHSMIRSIGLDGSGEHWTSTSNKFSTIRMENRKLSMGSNVIPDKEILKARAKYHPFTFKNKIKLILEDMGMGNIIIFINRRIRGKS